jgi:hypothetical protein
LPVRLLDAIKRAQVMAIGRGIDDRSAISIADSPATEHS